MAVTTRYMSQNKTEADAAWDAILPGHGLFAVAPEWAAERTLRGTMRLKTNASQVVYGLDAYHSLHCIVGSKCSIHLG